MKMTNIVVSDFTCLTASQSIPAETFGSQTWHFIKFSVFRAMIPLLLISFSAKHSFLVMTSSTSVSPLISPSRLRVLRTSGETTQQLSMCSNHSFRYSDGYCNSRIVIVDPQGKVIGSIANGDLSVAHSVSLLESEDLICVADREGRRVACYSAGLNGSQAGKLIVDLRNQLLGRVYAIDHLADILFAVNGPDENAESPAVVGIDLPSERVIGKFSTEFFEPHDIAVAADGNSFFVSDIDGRAGQKIHQFSLTS